MAMVRKSINRVLNLTKLNLRPYGKYIQFGSQLGLSMALPIIAGFWLDERLDSSPWFLLTGIFLGVASSIWTVLKLAIEENIKDKKKKEDRERARKASIKETTDN